MNATGRKISRRAWLQGALAAAAPMVISSRGAAGGAPVPRTAIGMIGLGTMGSLHLQGFLQLNSAHVIAVCDVRESQREQARGIVDRHYAAAAAAGASVRSGRSGDCAVFHDYRDLLARPEIDAVVIATPDHWHARIAIDAALAGKDLYLEKPMAISIREGRAICDAVRRTGRVFQHGTQQRSAEHFRLACRLARNGHLGQVHTIRVGAPANIAGGSAHPIPVPSGLDYDRWLGPAPWAPYSDDRCNLGSWYYISDYTIGGFIGGWAVHHIDIAQWGGGTEQTGPVEVEGTGTVPSEGLYDTPTAYRVDCRFANGLRMIIADEKQELEGVRFEGERGWVRVNRSGIWASSDALLQTRFEPEEPSLYVSADHRINFLECIRSRRPAICPVETAHRSTTLCALAHIAIQTGQRLRWDPERECFPDHPAADRLLSRPSRAY